MMTKIFNIVYILLFVLPMLSCNKKDSNISLEKVKYNSNKSSYSTTKLDSLQSIQKITHQKVREVLELSILYNSGNKDSEIDLALHNQIHGYFYKPDSTTLRKLFTELDSVGAKNIKINTFSIKERFFKKDTLRFAQFNIEYLDEQSNSLGKFDREAQYILIPAEIQFKKEFKFYFLNFYQKPIKDSILVGVTK